MSAGPSPRETDRDPPSTRRGASLLPRLPRRGTRARRAKRRPGPVIVAVAVAFVALLAVLYVVGYLMAGDKLPRKAEVAGIRVGGLTRPAAVQRLTAELGPRTTAALAVIAGGRIAQVIPAEAGLQVDYAASVAAAGGGKSLNPAQILRVLTGGSNTDAVMVVDQARLSAAVQQLAGQVDQTPANATIAYAGAVITQTPGQQGITLVPQSAGAALVQGFLRPRSAPLELPVALVDPTVTNADADQVVAGYAKPAVAAPVKVTAGAGSFDITPAMIGGAISFAVKNGTLVPSLDPVKLRSNAEPVAKQVALTKAKNATVRIVDGKPKVIAAVDGASIGAAELAQAVEPVLTKAPAERTAQVQLTKTPASFTTDQAQKLGIKEVTGQFTTYFSYVPYRNTNIPRAAQLINNTLLKPGATFSLNKIVGKPTKKSGFTEGYVIKGGKLAKEVGGGASQSATTTYSAMFFAGLKDTKNKGSTYVNRYPPGREATVAWPNPNPTFQNNTDYGVLVQASVVKGSSSRRGSITVKLWSTKTYDRVTSTAPGRSNFTTGGTIRSSSSSCEPVSSARGYDADLQRLFYRGAAVVKREDFRWRYLPTNQVVCT